MTVTRRATLMAALAAAFLATPVAAHPGSGIVADRKGQVYFIDTGAGVWKIDARGTIAVAATGCGRVHEIAPDGTVKTVLQVESPWSPTAVVRVGRDLYVLEYLHTATEDRQAWRPRVRRVSADGTSVVLATVERR